jgi:hypothetical protein
MTVFHALRFGLAAIAEIHGFSDLPYLVKVGFHLISKRVFFDHFMAHDISDR